MSEPLPREIRCVLIPSGGVRLLLPNAAVAEVITLTKPEPVADAPEWLPGRIGYRGWQVPLVSFAHLAKAGDEDVPTASRVAVLKALGNHPRLPFIAVLTQGFPRLTTLNAELILPTHDGSDLPFGVRAQVLVRDDTAIIPDLEALEETLVGLLGLEGDEGIRVAE
ncbi:chemosensory pili system protein ChpC [Luteibacter rhizovicinus]|uniref:Chemosensory pili system protein ChpC n=1 Tax=Luteibacter rhizovicinus TaxID=242606 RepID=A0A4R3YRD9_9GAMM|nr:chemotaxis protein CheW [Luteibacter rhizovicinus]TCV94208.1 chemosensory pili system protein ChpC [Luteibacter rhizovicinus]